jgi:hypothetical protein
MIFVLIETIADKISKNSNAALPVNDEEESLTIKITTYG